MNKVMDSKLIRLDIEVGVDGGGGGGVMSEILLYVQVGCHEDAHDVLIVTPMYTVWELTLHDPEFKLKFP